MLAIVLWTIVGTTTIQLAAIASARYDLLVASHRRELLVTYWGLRGCLAIARSHADQELSRANPGQSNDVRTWENLDRWLGATMTNSGCALEVFSSGRTYPTRLVSDSVLSSSLQREGIDSAASARLVSTLRDWEDADSAPRKLGAEKEIYLGLHLPTPRNEPARANKELSRVLGWDALGARLSLFGVTNEPMSLEHAPTQALRLLPGVDEGAIARITELRERNVSSFTWEDVLREISQADRLKLQAGMSRWLSATTSDVDSWTLRFTTDAKGKAGHCHLSATVRRDGRGIAIQNMLQEWDE